MIVGFILADLPWVSGIILLSGILWFVVEIKGWGWPGSLILFLIVISAAVGIVVQVEPIWSILATVFALAAWEFSYFMRTIQNVRWVRLEEVLEARHNRRVLLVSVLSVLLAWATTQIQVDFGFGIALLLAIVSLLGLSRAVVFLRRSG
jgi:hypothetical protein